jgi:hypothetical protein
MLDRPILPHHKLLAFGVAKELLIAVRETAVRDTHLRDQAMRAAQSARSWYPIYYRMSCPSHDSGTCDVS